MPSRAPRRERKKARTRREILGAALRLLAERDLDAVTIDEICAAADVARATFFLHFASKRALLGAWGRELARELAERLRERPGNALADYRAVVELLGERWAGRARLVRALVPELLSPPAAGAPRPEGPDLLDVVEELVARGQRRGELRRNLPPRLAASALLATLAAAVATREGRVRAGDLRSPLLGALLHGAAEPKPRLKWSVGGAPAARDGGLASR